MKKGQVDRRSILISMAVVYAVIFLIFYPQFHTFYDESLYVHGAWLLKEGKSLKVSNPIESLTFIEHSDHFVSHYPIGVPIILIPFAAIGGLFISGLVLHLIGFFIFSRIMKRLKYDEIFSVLYLLFPGFVFFSRTVMSEIPSVVAILAAFYFYLGEKKSDNVLAGAFFGAACLFRYTNLLIAMPFFVITFWRAIKTKKIEKLVLMCAGFVPFAVGILYYNAIIYGGMFKTGITTPRPAVSQMISIFGKFLVAMLIVYPLMIIAPFIYKGKMKEEIVLSTLVFVGLFSFAGIDTFHYDFAKNMVIGARYLFPVVPLMLIAYVPFFIGICKFFKLKYKAILYVVMLFLFIGYVGISYKQYSFTNSSKEISNTIYANTEDGSLIFGNGYTLSFVNNFIGERKGTAIRTHRSPEEPDEEFSDEVRGLKYVYGNYKDHTTYLVFLEQQFVQDFRDDNEAGIIEEGRNELLRRFNNTLVFSQDTPSPLFIYKIE
jgi:hypothetical protein